MQETGSNVVADDLAGRIRSALKGRQVSEQKMFGGTGFMLNGNMVAGTFRNELLVRVGKEGNDAALGRPHARPMDHGGRPVAGYVIVGSQGTAKDKDLKSWVDLAVAHVESLPAKEPRKSPPSPKPAAGRKSK
jgi:TfoX/Sxy family transcriptional regulator of competence genes